MVVRILHYSAVLASMKQRRRDWVVEQFDKTVSNEHKLEFLHRLGRFAVHCGFCRYDLTNQLACSGQKLSSVVEGLVAEGRVPPEQRDKLLASPYAAACAACQPILLQTKDPGRGMDWYLSFGKFLQHCEKCHGYKLRDRLSTAYQKVVHDAYFIIIEIVIYFLSFCPVYQHVRAEATKASKNRAPGAGETRPGPVTRGAMTPSAAVREKAIAARKGTTTGEGKGVRFAEQPSTVAPIDHYLHTRAVMGPATHARFVQQDLDQQAQDTEEMQEEQGIADSMGITLPEYFDRTIDDPGRDADEAGVSGDSDDVLAAADPAGAVDAVDGSPMAPGGAETGAEPAPTTAAAVAIMDSSALQVSS